MASQFPHSSAQGSEFKVQSSKLIPNDRPLPSDLKCSSQKGRATSVSARRSLSDLGPWTSDLGLLFEGSSSAFTCRPAVPLSCSLPVQSSEFKVQSSQPRSRRSQPKAEKLSAVPLPNSAAPIRLPSSEFKVQSYPQSPVIPSPPAPNLITKVISPKICARRRVHCTLPNSSAPIRLPSSEFKVPRLRTELWRGARLRRAVPTQTLDIRPWTLAPLFHFSFQFFKTRFRF